LNGEEVSVGLVIDLLVKYHQAFLTGLWVTIELTLIIWTTGLLIGGTLGVLSAQHRRAVGIPMRVVAFLLSGIPVLVFLFWMHYPMQAMLGIVIDPFLTAALVFSIINILAVADLVRSYLVDFPEQYRIAALVCGLDRRTYIFRIQMPILLRQILPGLLPLQIVMLHSTLFASLISVEEVFRVSQRINALEYKPIHIYTALAVFFLAICLPVNTLAIWLRIQFTRDISEN
jgi:His/Glu/Gln/Arg/opine family amino acid ABC transporter permease subunit